MLHIMDRAKKPAKIVNTKVLLNCFSVERNMTMTCYLQWNVHEILFSEAFSYMDVPYFLSLPYTEYHRTRETPLRFRPDISCPVHFKQLPSHISTFLYVIRAVYVAAELEVWIFGYLESLRFGNIRNFRIVQIQKQRKRQLMIALRTTEPSELFEIDTERELETIHMALYEHAETLKHWKNALEGTEIPEGQPPLPRALQDQVSVHCIEVSRALTSGYSWCILLYSPFTSFDIYLPPFGYWKGPITVKCVIEAVLNFMQFCKFVLEEVIRASFSRGHGISACVVEGETLELLKLDWHSLAGINCPRRTMYCLTFWSINLNMNFAPIRFLSRVNSQLRTF